MVRFRQIFRRFSIVFQSFFDRFRTSKFFGEASARFIPRGWLRSAPNFGKTRFRQSLTFHFSTPKKEFPAIFLLKFPASDQETAVLEEPRFFERYWQIRLETLPPMNSISALYDFWRRGEKVDFYVFVDCSAKTDLQFWLYND